MGDHLLLKLAAAVVLAFGGLLAWSNQRATARHDPRRSNGPNDVVLLSAEWCGYCQAEKRALTAAQVPFRELDVEHDSEGRQAYDAVGGHGIPVTVIGKDIVFGFDASRLNRLLAARGYQVNLQ